MHRRFLRVFLACLFIMGSSLLLPGNQIIPLAEARPSAHTVTISGRLGDGYLPVRRIHHHHHQPDRGARLVDSVLAIPVANANLSYQGLARAVKTPVHPNGSFDITLSRDLDYVLVLFNSSTETPAKFAGQLAFRIEASDSPLLFMPTGKLLDRNVNLGIIDAEGNIAMPRHVLRNRLWALTPPQLAFLATNGMSYTNVKNLVINYDGGNGIFYSLRPDFHWDGFYSGIKKAFGYPSMYRHYNFQLDSNAHDITMDMICGTNGVARSPLELFPPSGVSISASDPPMVYDSANPISNNNAVCSLMTNGFIEAKDEDFFATNRYSDISYSLGISLLTDPVPGGYWQYRVNGVMRAQFDVGVSAPKTADGMVNGLIPAIHANLDAGGKITSFNIKWYQRDESNPNKYTEVTDLSMLSYLVSSAGIFIENTSTGQRRYESVTYDPATQTSVSMANDWYYGNSGAVSMQAEQIGTFYSSAGLGYFFEYPRIITPEGDPQCILPVTAAEIPNVYKGQQYNPLLLEPHYGLDFGFIHPTLPGQYTLHDIVAPVSGIVTEINGHIITGGGNSSNTYAYTVTIWYNDDWSTFVCFEPDSLDQTIVDLQKQKINVSVGQIINQGDVIGQLVVSLPVTPQVFGPHVHWQLYRNDNNKTTVCPRTYSTPAATATLDALYQAAGISQPCAVP
jgi:hypothetical protein